VRRPAAARQRSLLQGAARRHQGHRSLLHLRGRDAVECFVNGVYCARSMLLPYLRAKQQGQGIHGRVFVACARFAAQNVLCVFRA
jgi:hypothetical protein